MKHWTATPDTDYADPAALDAAGTSQFAGAQGMVYWSGFAPMNRDSRIIGAGDIDAQIAHVLEKLGEGLGLVGSGTEQIVSLTIYAPDLDRLIAAFWTHYLPWIGSNRPALTMIGGSQLSHPGHLLEVQGVATALGR